MTFTCTAKHPSSSGRILYVWTCFWNLTKKEIKKKWKAYSQLLLPMSTRTPSPARPEYRQPLLTILFKTVVYLVEQKTLLCVIKGIYIYKAVITKWQTEWWFCLEPWPYKLKDEQTFMEHFHGNTQLIQLNYFIKLFKRKKADEKKLLFKDK